jgi:hypothetical protein
MPTQKPIPEEATVEPRVLTPEEEAERARQAVEISAAEELDGDPLSVADADSPVRMPGEMSTRPPEAGDQGVGTSRSPSGPATSARR